MADIEVIIPDGLTEDEQKDYREKVEPLVKALQSFAGAPQELEALDDPLDDPDADLLADDVEEPELSLYFIEQRAIFRTLIEYGNPKVLH